MACELAAMKFSIITPSFRSNHWLKLCIASVADQKGVEWEHIVQDSCSDDGTQLWLREDRRVQAHVEKDSGMYDAVNRGYRRATGDVLAYLNCDEQYLPDALVQVQQFFEQHPEIEVAIGGTVITNEAGEYVCHRPSIVPRLHGIAYRFAALTSGIFVRRKVIAERNIGFDARWRALGDLHWMRALLQQQVPMAIMPGFQAAFADTGSNLGDSPAAQKEAHETLKLIPLWARLLKPYWIAEHRVRRLAAGHFNLSATQYEIYTHRSPDRRVRFEVPRATAVWRSRL